MPALKFVYIQSSESSEFFEWFSNYVSKYGFEVLKIFDLNFAIFGNN